MILMKKNNKGFTLAELLIVVAIIAVLVAIAIPVFTTQLEKSKEGTDIANLRSAYAAGQVAALTGFYGSGASTEISPTGEVKLEYNPNIDGSLSGADGGISIGQGTATDGKASTSGISGGIIEYDTNSNVKGKHIKVDIKDGVLSKVYFG
jgi:type IV pilus assembly protein PilA